MNPKVCLALATLSVLCHVSSGIFVFETAAAGTAATAVTISGGAAGAALLGGGLLLKGLAVGALLASRGGRGKRSADDQVSSGDAAFAVIAAVEPAQCLHQLVCDLATGALPANDNDVILSLFKSKPGKASPKVTFYEAAVDGKLFGSVEKCRVKYSCPVPVDAVQPLRA